jgi:hypothetical protein
VVFDTDEKFIIDSATRAISNSREKPFQLIQHDHNAEKFSFVCDRYVEGHDMSLCNKVEIHYDNIESSKRRTSHGLYEVQDFRVDPTDDNKVIFTWLISGNATLYNGTLVFLVSFACVEGTEVTYRWNTSVNNSTIILTGLNNSDNIANIYADILENWKKDLFGVGDTEEARLSAAAEKLLADLKVSGEHAVTTAKEKLDEVVTKANQSLASIPDEYAELGRRVTTLEAASYIPRTEINGNIIKETFVDGTYKITTMVNNETITEQWFTSEDVLTRTVTITIKDNVVTEVES